MTWTALLFAHWPIEPGLIATKLPAGLELDTFEGRAWLGIVPFLMSGVRLGFLPPVPGARLFPELNVRTYVRGNGKAGVWFFSLDAASLLAVLAARATVGLPYFWSRMAWRVIGSEVHYSSRRLRPWRPEVSFEARYAPVGAVRRAAPGTLDHWLTERYCLFARRPDGRIVRGDIHHDPWPLRQATASFSRETVARAAGFVLPDVLPVLHFADRLDVLAWRPVPADHP
jgi:uncharacterized protein YqjF (DUF2071 family)